MGVVRVGDLPHFGCGWAGMVRQIELLRGDRVVHSAPEGTLVEFLAVRLLLDRFALGYVARKTLGYTRPLNGLRDFVREKIETPGSSQRRAGEHSWSFNSLRSWGCLPTCCTT